MLVLTRREGESLMIGDDIEITVKRIDGTSRVQIAIDAPQHVRVVRGELEKEGDNVDT